VNALDYAVLVCLLLGIALFGIWQTRERRNLAGYLKGVGQTRWLTIGLSVMATQASAITFLSTPGQGYESGLGFVQNYFGAPFALIVVSAAFLPIYRKLGVYTAYEYLGRRFDSKTRLLGAGLFLLQRGLGAGITIYAPAIVLSTVLGWPLDLTIVCSGILVVAYTVSGGSDAVNLTQKYQIGVIFAGMVAAFLILVARLPHGLGIGGALALAGKFHKLEAVDFSLDVNRRYTLWTGLLGGFFLALSYFGTDQSQVQRYLSGGSLRESRLGLMFNAVFKIPMQFFILLLGVLLFVFYQFERPPVFFNEVAWGRQAAGPGGAGLKAMEDRFGSARAEEAGQLRAWLDARRAGDRPAEAAALRSAQAAGERAEVLRSGAKAALRAADPKTAAGDADYVFIGFILRYLPHGLVGLLVAAFFAAAFSSKSAELNALGSTTTVDIYRHVVRREATDRHYVAASRVFTALWGAVAIAFALFANLTENLIQAVNIVGSLFYGGVLGIFLVAFFLRWIGGTAIFWSAIAGQVLVIVLYLTLNISYLWYNLIGCAACVVLGAILQGALALAASRGAPAPP
jgi:Na+/proline symporter